MSSILNKRFSVLIAVICVLSVLVHCGSDGSGSGDNSESGSITEIEISLSVSGTEGTSADLSWTAADSGGVIAGYNVYRSLESGGAFEKVNASVIAATEYTAEELYFVYNTKAPEYFFKVKAVDAYGNESAYSNEESAVIVQPIYVPDNQNNRIVMIDDMSGGGWHTSADNSPANFGISGSTYDYQHIDVDRTGRIYFTIWDSSRPDNMGLYRVDGITSATHAKLMDITDIYAVAVAVDRVNNLVYASNGVTLYRTDLDGNLDGDNNISTAEAIFSPAALDGVIYAIAVDEDGMLYVSLSCSSTYWGVLKFNPETKEVVDYCNLWDSFGYLPNDVMVDDTYLYVLDFTFGEIDRIDKSNMNLVDSIGQIVDHYDDDPYDTQPLHFGHPWRFVAILRREIIIAQNGYDKYTPFHRLTGMDDFDGTNWTIYGSHGSGVNQFDFVS